ncbi:hypothetical protein Tco_0449969 [Tanacetum coccineum]
MGSADELLPAPAMAPIHCANLLHNRRYGIDGEIMAFVVIIVFLIFLFCLIVAPCLIRLRKSSRNSTPVVQNIGSHAYYEPNTSNKADTCTVIHYAPFTTMLEVALPRVRKLKSDLQAERPIDLA